MIRAYRGGMSEVLGDADIAAVGALLADPGRCRMLVALGDGRALPASRLAVEAGVSASTASSHLRKLGDAGMLEVEVSGRHRYYRLAGAQIADLIETLQRLAPATPIRSLRAGTRAKALRDARTCYDHLAGRLGVGLMSSLLQSGYLDGGDGQRTEDDPTVGQAHEIDYTLTPSGSRFLDDFGVTIPPSRRPAIRYCVDWTEQRHHLAGRLGRGLRDRIGELGWVEPARADRAVVVTEAGRCGFADTFGIAV
jgi:DNA-binding transcriptional ArsR family regulator